VQIGTVERDKQDDGGNHEHPGDLAPALLSVAVHGAIASTIDCWD